jgi:ribonuclease HI
MFAIYIEKCKTKAHNIQNTRKVLKMRWQNNLTNKIFGNQTLNFFSDGAVRPKPPAASSAVVVKDVNGNVVDWFSRLLPVMSNNEAEYFGLTDSIALALRLKPAMAYFHLDSQIVVGQVAGGFAVRDRRLKALHTKVKEAEAKLKAAGINYEIFHIKREFNLLADALAADALLAHPETQRKTFQQLNLSGKENPNASD